MGSINSSVFLIPLNIPVLTSQGHTTVIDILCYFLTSSSSLSASWKVYNADLLAEYSTKLGTVKNAANEAILTIWPHEFSSILGNNNLVILIGPNTFT